MTPQKSRFCSKVLSPSELLILGGPAGGSGTWKGVSPPKDRLHMTRRAFLALRVIRRQGEFDFQWSFERIWLGVSFWNVFRRFLVIHEFVLSGVSKINYFRSRRVRWSIRELQDISFSGPIFVLKCRLNLQNWQDFWKSERYCDISGFGRPCRGRSTWKGASRPTMNST